MPQTERMFLRMDPSDRELIGFLRERWGTGDEAKTIREAIRRAAEGEGARGDSVKGLAVRGRDPVEVRARVGIESAAEAPRVRLAVPRHLAVDLLEAARAGKLDAVVGRAKEMERLLSLLVRLTRNCVMLVGEAGTGKTAIAQGLAVRMAAGEVPDVLRDRGLLAVDGAELALVAGYGEPSAALKLVEGVVEHGRRGAILVLNRMGALVDMWNDGSAALARLRLALVRGEVQVIGEMTPERYRRWAEADGLSSRFEELAVAPAGREEAVAVLRALKEDLERHHDVVIAEEALTTVAALAADRKLGLPRGAVDLLDEAAGRAHVRGETRVTPEVVAEAVAAR